MRRLSLLFVVLFAASPALGQQSKPSQSGNAEPLNLPVSLDKIREALSQRAPELLKGLTPAPVDSATFRVNITEQQKFEELLSTLKFEAPGPQVAGGVDAYDQYRRLFPPIDNPLVQPYAAFSTAQVITLGAEALIEKYVAEKMAHVVGTALREQAERDAREEVARALAAATQSR